MGEFLPQVQFSVQVTYSLQSPSSWHPGLKSISRDRVETEGQSSCLWSTVPPRCKQQAWTPPPEKAVAPHSSTLAGKSHGWRSLVGCSPWGLEESDTTEQLHFHFSLSCIGEGNGNPLQCSCLENPRDRGAWWAAVYGVTQSDATEAT